MEYLRLCLAVENRGFPGGLVELLRNDLERSAPPVWADGIRIVESPFEADAVLLVLNGDPSDGLRRIFYYAFNWALPVAALSAGESSSEDSMLAKLRSWGSLWVFRSTDEARRAVAEHLSSWLATISRDGLPYPCGDALLESYGRIDPSQLDAPSLDHAVEVVSRRGFVCLSGSISSGKTSMARFLLSMSAKEGLNPVELISTDLDTKKVESLLTGPEDCVVLYDLDTLRRFTGIWSAFIWDTVLSLMIRATEQRRRLVLASSSPKLEILFGSYGDAHVVLPAPSDGRGWRLEQGQAEYSRLVSLDPLDAAEHVLISMFEPVVSESLFRHTLFELWERLFVIHRRSFPSIGELEDRYAASDAARGIAPFRRVVIDGETHFATSDTTRMNAMDGAIAVRASRRDPLIHSLSEILLSSREPRVRKAGFSLAHFYGSLEDDERATLLHAASREEDGDNLADALTVLLKDQSGVDRGIVSLCDRLSQSGNHDQRAILAEISAMQWIRSDPRFQPVLDRLTGDLNPGVRASFMRGISFWGLADDPGGRFGRLVGDRSDEVRDQLMAFTGSRFPRIRPDELEAVNEVLASGNGRLMSRLAWGLLNRAPEQFSDEFTDLLWILLGKLPAGGRGMVARQIGGRLRYFDRDIRRELLTNLEEKDRTAIVMCLLMNYSWLTPEEEAELWNLASSRIAIDHGFASMILRYFRVFDRKRQLDLVKTALAAEAYHGREALGQLMTRQRWDLVETTITVCRSLISSAPVETRARLAWFVLLNSGALGKDGREFIETLAGDPSPPVRSSVARAVLRQGLNGETAEWLLGILAGDPERSVRAVAGEALGRLSGRLGPVCSSILEQLLTDEDSTVRSRTLKGFPESVHLPVEELLERLSTASRDPSPGVRREVVSILHEHHELLDEPSTAEMVAGLLKDQDEKIRMESARLVTASPALLASEPVRRRLPDLLLNRVTSGATIQEELSTAREIQMDLLPDHPPRLESFDIEFFYSPAREIGGDYYDFFRLPENNLGLAIGDVTGKGIPAALTMASLKGNLAAQVQNIYSISEIMRRVNDAASTGAEGSSLIGLFYGVLNLDSGLLTYVNAGHNPPVLIKREGQTKLLTEGGLLLGALPGAAYENGYVSIEAADILILYTDGITEAMNREGEEFGISRLVDVSLQSHDLSSRQIVSRILDSVNRHSAGQPRADDQTLVVVRRR